MKQILLLIATVFIAGVSVHIYAEEVALAPQVVAQMPETAPVVTEPKLPMPPAWLETVMNVAMKIPIVGPVLLQAAQWIGVVASVFTVLVTALLALMQSLSVILKWAKFGDLAVKIVAFQNSSIFYWLRFFSIYNAKKVEKPKA